MPNRKPDDRPRTPDRRRMAKSDHRPRMTVAIVALVSALAGALAVVLPGAATTHRPQTVAVSNLLAATQAQANRAMSERADRTATQERNRGTTSGRKSHGTATDRAPRRYLRGRGSRRDIGSKRRRAKRRKARRRSVRVGPTGVPGPPGPTGPAGPQISTSLAINWRGFENAPGHDGAAGQIGGVGTLFLTCSATTQTLSLVPAGNGGRSVLSVTTFEGEGTAGASSYQRLYSESTAPISIDLPNNGMISGTISAEPIGSDGPLPAPATFLLSTEWKNNDPDPTRNYCFVAAQVLQ